jgi:hypothetical protein
MTRQRAALLRVRTAGARPAMDIDRDTLREATMVAYRPRIEYRTSARGLRSCRRVISARSPASIGPTPSLSNAKVAEMQDRSITHVRPSNTCHSPQERHCRHRRRQSDTERLVVLQC